MKEKHFQIAAPRVLYLIAKSLVLLQSSSGQHAELQDGKILNSWRIFNIFNNFTSVRVWGRMRTQPPTALQTSSVSKGAFNSTNTVEETPF